MFKAGQVGLGGMGGGHFFSHRAVSPESLAGVADIRYDFLKQRLSDFQLTEVPHFSSMEEMIEAVRPDYVDIVTPTFTHADLAIKAMEMGCHVICEKPMSLFTDDCDRMIEASRRTGKRLMIAHVVRFMAPYMYLRSVVKSGKLGRLLRLDMKRISAVPRWSCDNWMMDFDKAGGVILDLSIHDIDFMRYLCGDPKDFSGLYYKMKDETEYSSVSFLYDGFSVSVEGGWYKADVPFFSGYTALFEGGIIKDSGGETFENGNKVEYTPGMPELDIGAPSDTLDGYTREIQYFESCLASGAPFDMSAAESSSATIALCRELINGLERI